MDLFITILLAIVAFDVLFVAMRLRAAMRHEPRPVAHGPRRRGVQRR